MTPKLYTLFYLSLIPAVKFRDEKQQFFRIFRVVPTFPLFWAGDLSFCAKPVCACSQGPHEKETPQ